MIDVLTAMTLFSVILPPLVLFQISEGRKVRLNLYQVIATNQISNFAELLSDEKNTTQNIKALSAWNNTNKLLLPEGFGTYQIISSHICLITLQWFYQKIRRKQIKVFC